MDKIEVTQADRDAAAAVVQAYRDNKNGNWQARIRNGECDDGYIVQAFARHRLATRTDATPVAWHSPLGSLIEARQIARQAYKDIEREKAINGHVPGNPYDVALAALNSTLGCLAELVNHPPATDVAALVEAAKEAARGFDATNLLIEAVSGSPSIMVETFAERLRQALAPFTKGQNDDA